MAYQQSNLVSEYIARFDAETQRRLHLLRNAIQATFPNTIEDISYGMPTYRPAPGKRGIIHFAAAAGHIGIYAVFDPKNNSTMHEKMKPYRTGRATLQFRNTEPFPMTTIRQILVYHASHFPAQAQQPTHVTK